MSDAQGQTLKEAHDGLSDDLPFSSQTAGTIEFEFRAMQHLPRFGMRPISRNKSNILCAIRFFSIAPAVLPSAMRTLIGGDGVTFHHSPPSPSGVLSHKPGHRTF
jgi:hypothetical protein